MKAVNLIFRDGTSFELTFEDGSVKPYDILRLFGKYPQFEALKTEASP